MRTQTGATSASWALNFQDVRAPQEILTALERDLMKVFATSTKDGKLAYSALVKINGVPYEFELRYEAALLETNAYSLCVNASWGEMPTTHHDYFSKSSDSWIKFWTRDFKQSESVAAGDGSPERYAKIRDEALRAESRLDSVPDIERAIVDGIKGGATFSTAHKEGGSVFKWSDGQFIRSDYGENPDLRKFANEAEFLGALRQFFDWDTSRAFYPNKAPELDVWKLIFRKMYNK